MRTLKHALLLLMHILPVISNGQTYSTDFAKSENPISENGNWTNGGRNGIDWTNVMTDNGMAFGTETGADTGIYRYNDSYAVLSGFPPDQTAEAVVHYSNPRHSCSQEVELLLRWTSVAHLTTGYECLFRCMRGDGFYMQVVRWNGPLGHFTYIANLRGPSPGIKDHDTLRASVYGNIITLYINDIQKLQCTDSTFHTGNPGIGFFLSGCSGSNADFGFTSFKATGSKKSSHKTY